MISAIVLTKNEEKNIVDCLESLHFCNEIIIVDDESSDRTNEIVKNYSKEHENVNHFSRKLNFNFSEQRKFGISKAKNNWILFLDADERISPELAIEIKENVTVNSTFSGYMIRRIDFMWGKELKHGETGNIKLLRLFDKREGKLIGRVHETWKTKSAIGRLVNPIFHYPHPTISEFLEEINLYTDLRAEELYNQKKKSNIVSIVLYPEAKFFVNYIIKLGILDGIEGFIHASLMSLHSFLVRGKLWLMWKNK